MIVNKRQLAEVFGTSEETLTRWAKLGCPVEEKRRGTQGSRYDTQKVFRWRLARAEHAGEPTDLEHERLLLLKTQRKQADIDLRLRKGTLGVVADFEQAVGTKLVTTRDELLTIADRTAAKVASLTDIRECWTVVDEAVRLALRHIGGSASSVLTQ